MGRELDSSDSDHAVEAARPCSKRHICQYDGCGAAFSRPGRLGAHLDLHEGKKQFECTVAGCDRVYTNNAHLKRHVATFHTERSSTSFFICPEPSCKRQLSTQLTLDRHLKTHNKSFLCETCGAGFSKHWMLSAHLVTHTGVFPFKCEKCDLKFATSYLLKRHERGHKTHTCPHSGCGITCDTWTQLRKHIKLEHPPQFKCADCSRVFTNKSLLRLHLEVHIHPLDRDVLLCPHENCSRFYFHRRNLIQHIKSSHEGKRVPCDQPGCERTFCNKVQETSQQDVLSPGLTDVRRMSQECADSGTKPQLEEVDTESCSSDAQSSDAKFFDTVDFNLQLSSDGQKSPFEDLEVQRATAVGNTILTRVSGEPHTKECTNVKDHDPASLQNTCEENCFTSNGDRSITLVSSMGPLNNPEAQCSENSEEDRTIGDQNSCACANDAVETIGSQVVGLGFCDLVGQLDNCKSPQCSADEPSVGDMCRQEVHAVDTRSDCSSSCGTREDFDPSSEPAPGLQQRRNRSRCRSCGHEVAEPYGNSGAAANILSSTTSRNCLPIAAEDETVFAECP